MEGKTLLRAAIIVSCVAVTALGLQNSNGDNSDVVALATKAACSSADCEATLGQTSRSSFGHEYAFQTRQGSGRNAVLRGVVVACRRELYLVGAWSCAPRANE